MQPQLEPTNKGHRILVLSLTILLTAGATGGGVYYVLGQQIKKQGKLIEELQKKSETKTETKTEEKKEETKDETADWKTYTNESFGITFKYSATYTTTKDDNPKANAANAGSVILTDNTRVGKPKISLLFNPDGIGGCSEDADDVIYKTTLKNGKIILGAKENGTNECDDNGNINLNFPIMSYNSISVTGKNAIGFTFSYAKGTDFESEFTKIIGTLSISKENLYQ